MDIKNFESVGYWWADDSIELVKLSDGNIYALNGWNGEKYTDCWKCNNVDYFEVSGTGSYELQPEHIEIGGDFEIVDYIIK